MRGQEAEDQEKGPALLEVGVAPSVAAVVLPLEPALGRSLFGSTASLAEEVVLGLGAPSEVLARSAEALLVVAGQVVDVDQVGQAPRVVGCVEVAAGSSTVGFSFLATEVEEPQGRMGLVFGALGAKALQEVVGLLPFLIQC